MARKLRIQHPGAIYHVMNRGDHQERIFCDDEDRQLLLDAVSHFEHEERVLSECAYPWPKGHAALHLQMRAEFEHAMEEMRNEAAQAMWAEYGLLVAQLVVEHMRQETMTYRNSRRSSSHSYSQRT